MGLRAHRDKSPPLSRCGRRWRPAPFSWFIGVGLAAPAYWLVMRGHPSLAGGETEPRPSLALAEAESESEDVASEHHALFGEETDRFRFGEETEAGRS
jgi:hypothetical protein